MNCLKWLNNSTSTSFYNGTNGFADEKLLCGTDDGMLLCLDRTGKIFASLQLEIVSTTATSRVSVRSIETDGRLIFGGCSDGSIRCWLMHSNAMVEVYRQTAAHTGAVTALSLSMQNVTHEQQRHHQHQLEQEERQYARNSIHGGGGGNVGHSSSNKFAVQYQYSAAQFTALLVSAGDDCSVRIWRVHCSGDY